MTYRLVLTGRFKKGLKRAKKRGMDIGLLATVEDDILTLTLVDTGTHSDLFDM